MLSAKTKNVQQMIRRLKRIQKRFPDAVRAALYIEVEVEVKEAKRRTPVDTGNLRASIFQDGPKRNGRIIMTSIVAGGPAAPYAVYVHENLDAYHPVGQAKYIESVIMEARPHLAGRIARRLALNQALGGA